MNQLARAAAAFTVGLVGSIATITAVNEIGGARGTGELASTVLGQPDFDGYCKSANPTSAAVLVSQDADGWRCAGRRNDIFFTHDIEPAEVCTWQHGPGTRARLSDADAPVGWQCVGAP